MRIRSIAAVALCATLATVSACKRQSAQGATRDTTAAVGPVNVTAVDLGRSIDADNKIKDATATFRPRDTVFVVVETSGQAGGTLQSRWSFHDGQVVKEASQPVAADSRTEFHVSKPDGWPIGRYRVEILHNGAVLESKEFEVK